MKTNDFENALRICIKECNNFFKPLRFPFQIIDEIPDFSFALFLDIYCEKKPFYHVSRNKLFENVETEGTISSKSTLNKNYKDFKEDLKYSPTFNNCTFDFGVSQKKCWF